jgi:hypothetical protein
MSRWSESWVAEDNTHHLFADRPLYADRFDEVLKFHAPGLAPVRRAGEAWHVREDGCPAYTRRFLRTFGYYEGRAAVTARDGWHHITVAGDDLYPERRAWCGNFQNGRCPVRDTSGEYYHITADGSPAYRERWRYAGDYRDGFAVVQRADGWSTHIDCQGRPLHDRWFLDLDVFHKGFARARDESGWLHVDRAGHPMSTRRFGAVEPFYNGQARVERLDGGLEIIDETARCIVELRPARCSEFHALSSDIVGAWRTDTLAVAVDFRIFSALPNAPTEIAACCGITVDGATRLLRALAELGVVTRDRNGTWHPTERGAYLREDHPETLADAAREAAGPQRERWSHLAMALRDAAWCPPDIFREVAASPARSASHSRMLRSYAHHDYTPLVARLPLPDVGLIVDAGGGVGVLAEQIAELRPGASVVLLELPEVIAQLPVPRRFAAMSADLFATWPVAADLVLFTRVLHDWDDEQALALLRRACEALEPDGQIAILELLLGEESPGGGLCDLHLRVVTGGRERTLGDFEALLRRAGLRLVRHERMSTLLHLLIGAPI